MRLHTQLTTQCPQCGGQFAVSMAQLQLRKGFVRCVHCAHIFDGYETVVPETDAALTSRGKSVMEPHAPPDSGENTPDVKAGVIQFTPPLAHVQEPPVVIRQRLAAHADHPVSSQTEEPFLTSDPAPTLEDSKTPWHEDANARMPQLSETIYAERRLPPMAAQWPDVLADKARPWAFWTWSVLSVLALVLVLAQIVVIYRVQIAHAMPTTRILLERVCQVWGCQLAYPRHLDQINILKSSLRLQAPSDQTSETDKSLVLHLTLENQYEQAQQWPTILLDLTDFSGAVVIRKHLHPADYLPENLANKPFAASSQLALRLPMVVQGISVNGYQIKPFFP